MAGGLTVWTKFLADTSDFVSKIGGMGKTMDKFGRDIQAHSTKFLMAGAAVGGAVAGLAAKGIQYGATIDRIARTTGEAAADISRLGYSAELLHGDTLLLEKGLRKVGNAVSDADDGLETYALAFRKAKIAVRGLDGELKSTTEVMMELADYFASNVNETEKLGVGYDILGGRNMKLMPWLKLGSAAIKEQGDRAEQLGMVLNDETATALENAGTKFKEVGLVSKGLGATFAVMLIPTINKLTGGMIKFHMWLNSMSSGSKQALLQLTGLSAAGLILLGVIGKLSLAFGFAAGPVVIILAGIMGLIAANTLLDSKMKDLNKTIREGTADQREDAIVKKVWLSNIKGLLFGIMTMNTQVGIAQQVAMNSFNDFSTAESEVEDATKAMRDELALLAEELEDGLANAFNKVGSAMDGPMQQLLKFNLEAGVSSVEDAVDSIGGALRVIPDLTADAMSQAEAHMVKTFSFSLGLFDSFKNSMYNTFYEAFYKNAEEGASHFLGVADQIWTQVAEGQRGLASALLETVAAFLRETLQMIIREAMQEMMVEKFKAVGKAVMQGSMNWAALASIPGIMAAYGVAVAGLKSIKFHTAGTLTGGGPSREVMAMVQTGETWITRATTQKLDAFLSGVGAGGTGSSFPVYANFPDVNTRSDAEWMLETLATKLQRKMRRR